MNKRIPPYYHSDGSNCWTENCSKGSSARNIRTESLINERINEMLDDLGAPKYTTVFSEEELKQHVDNQLLSVGKNLEHPQLSIYKYSRAAQFKKEWTHVTTACRGLIINHETGELIARPFPKFFNYQELTQEEIASKAVGPMNVMEKLDGSLIIGYVDPDGKYRLTTGGGFQASQKDLAEEIYSERYMNNWTPRPHTTYMWELIHPQNRIVVDYGNEKDLHLLGAVNIRTGKSIPLDDIQEWRWKKAVSYQFDSLSDVVLAPNRSNAEGYIVHFPETDFRIKLKHEEYVSLHRDATGLSERRVWNYLKNGTYEENRENLQEEFIDFYNKTGADILSRFNALKQSYYDEYDRLEASFEGSTKIDWVAHVRKNSTPEKTSIMLSWYDKEKTFNSVKENSMWESVKPEEVRSLWQMQNINNIASE